MTVFGHGTGASSVALHLISPKPKVLFQRAIMQSGAASAPYLPRKAANESVQKLAAAANCSFDDNLITCLREKSAEEIISLQSNIPTKALMELSNPVIDDDFIIGSPQKRYQKKKYFDNVQIMAGFTTHESSLDVFLRLGNASQVSKEEFKNVTGTLLEGLTQNKIVEQLVQYQYADDSDTTARERMIDFQSDFMTVAPMLFEAKALRKVIYNKKDMHTHTKLVMSTGVTHQNGLYPEALPERGVFFFVVFVVFYPGCQRLFMRGFRFRSSLISDPREKLSSGLRRHPAKAQLLVAREKKPLVPMVVVFRLQNIKG